MSDKKRFTVMVIPHWGKRTRSLNIHTGTLKVIGTISLILIISAALALSHYGTHYREMLSSMQELQHLKQENQALWEIKLFQEDQLALLTGEVDDLAFRLETLEQKEKTIRELLDLEEFAPYQRDYLTSNRYIPDRSSSTGGSETATRTSLPAYAWAKMGQLSEDIPAASASLDNLYIMMEEERLRLSGTPSLWPTRGRVTSAFGERLSPFTRRISFHRGIDIGVPWGTEVYAAADGVVEMATYHGGLGKTVTLRHPYGHTTLYAHLGNFAVEESQEVKKGQLIGYVGSTGYSTGPHLHYEVHERGEAVDPMKYLPD